MHEDKRNDFDAVLQAQQANAHLQACQHDSLDSDSSDEESVAGPEVNAHNQKKRVGKSKIQGPSDFTDSEDEDEQADEFPRSLEEVKGMDARAKVDQDCEERKELVTHEAATRVPEELLHFEVSEDEEVELPKHAIAHGLEKTKSAESFETEEGKATTQRRFHQTLILLKGVNKLRSSAKMKESSSSLTVRTKPMKRNQPSRRHCSSTRSHHGSKQSQEGG